MKRLERIIEKQDLCKPSVEEIEHSKVIFHIIGFFGDFVML